MLRSTMNIALIVLAGVNCALLVILYGFFASPNAVRTPPETGEQTLLLDRLLQN